MLPGTSRASRTAPSRDGEFFAQRLAVVVRDWPQLCKSRCLFACDHAQVWHFGNQRRENYCAITRDQSEHEKGSVPVYPRMSLSRSSDAWPPVDSKQSTAS